MVRASAPDVEVAAGDVDAVGDGAEGSGNGALEGLGVAWLGTLVKGVDACLGSAPAGPLRSDRVRHRIPRPAIRIQR